MKNWTLLDQMDFEADVKASEADAAYYKIGSKFYIMDSNYSYKEDQDEVCDPFF